MTWWQALGAGAMCAGAYRLGGVAAVLLVLGWILINFESAEEE